MRSPPQRIRPPNIRDAIIEQHPQDTQQHIYRYRAFYSTGNTFSRPPWRPLVAATVEIDAASPNSGVIRSADRHGDLLIAATGAGRRTGRRRLDSASPSYMRFAHDICLRHTIFACGRVKKRHGYRAIWFIRRRR